MNPTDDISTILYVIALKYIKLPKEVMIVEYRRKIAVVYSLEDALKEVNFMRQHGFFEHEIHISAKDIRPLHELKMYTDIDIRQAGSLFDKFLSVLLKMRLYEVGLRSIGFSTEELFHYGQLIEKGAIFMVAQHDQPIVKQTQKDVAFAKSNVLDRT